MRIQRLQLLCHHEMVGAFQYRNLFQLLPPSPQDPHPPIALAKHELTVEIQMEERVCPDREEDIWAHDIRERSRYDELQRKVKSTDLHWWETEKKHRESHRPRAILREVVNLLSSLTRHTFAEPQDADVWTLDTLTANRGPRITSIPAADYWNRPGPGAGDQVEFPDDVEELVEKYLSLSKELRVAFARSCELARTAREVWQTSRSMSLVTAVFAIDGLAHAAEAPPMICPECSQMTAEEKCNSCGASRFGLTARFREFVESHADVGERRKGFASDLYGIRSAIAHRGGLLRDDEFDSGFTAGGSDSQWDYRDVAFTLTRDVLRSWLCAQPVAC